MERMRWGKIRRATSLLARVVPPANGRRAKDGTIERPRTRRKPFPRIAVAHGERGWMTLNEPHGADFQFFLPIAQEAVS